MDIVALIAMIVSFGALVYAIFRDSSSDSSDLIDRVGAIETKVAVHQTKIDAIEDELDKVQISLTNLEKQMNEMNLKIERILTILEKE